MLTIKGYYRLLNATIALALLIGGWGCQDQNAIKPSDYLLRVGERSITTEAFKRALNLATDDEYAPDDLAEASLAALRIQVLNHLIVSNLLLQRAEALGLELTPQELRKAENEIKADYPPGEFEKTLLQQAIDYEDWSGALAERLLIQKVIEVDLKAADPLTDEDWKNLDKDLLVQYLQAKPEESAASGSQGAEAPVVADPNTLLAYLQLKKKQNAFDKYIDSLKQKYPVEINMVAWSQLTSNTDAPTTDSDHATSTLSTNAKE
jgi:hypothetical protein